MTSLHGLWKMFLGNNGSDVLSPQSPALIYKPDKVYFLCEIKSGWRVTEQEPLPLLSRDKTAQLNGLSDDPWKVA